MGPDFVQVYQSQGADRLSCEISVTNPYEHLWKNRLGCGSIVFRDSQAILEQSILPDFKNWSVIADMKTSETYLEIAQLLTSNQEILESLKVCFETPQTYFQENADRYDERCIDAEDDEASLQWIGLADELLESGSFVELDWNTEKEDFLYELESLVKKYKLPLQEEWFKEDGDIPLWAQTLDQEWESRGFCLAAMDIDSDSYVLFPCQVRDLSSLITLSQKLNQRFDYAKNM